MYLARYGSGKHSFVVAAIGLPRPGKGTSPQAQAWSREYLSTLRQVLSCPELDIGIRLTKSGTTFRRDLLLAATAEGERAILDLCRTFHRLNGFEAGSVEFCPDRARHDGLASSFPKSRGHVSQAPFRSGESSVACDFRVYGALEALLATTQRTDQAIGYQANLCRNRFDPDELRQVRKNFVRLSEMRNVPRQLLDHQRDLVNAMTDSEWLIDEYLGVGDPSLWASLRETLDGDFARSYGHLGFESLEVDEDDSGNLDNCIETGIHSSRALGFGVFERVSSAITAEAALNLLTWTPSSSRSLRTRKIFISYRREDSHYIAGRIYERLIHHFHANFVFMDVQSIPLGVDFRDVLAREGSAADICLALIGPRWVVNAAGVRRLDHEADYVRREIELALQKETSIIPLMVDGARIPTIEDLPPSLHPLHFLNGMPIRPDPDFDVDFDRLLRHLMESA